MRVRTYIFLGVVAGAALVGVAACVGDAPVDDGSADSGQGSEGGPGAQDSSAVDGNASLDAGNTIVDSGPDGDPACLFATGKFINSTGRGPFVATIRDIALVPDGHILVGEYRNVITFETDGGDAGPLVATNAASEAFVVKVAVNGSLVWQKSFGSTGSETLTTVTADSSGDIYVGGSFSSPTVSFGTHTVTSSPSGFDTGVVAKLAGATGTPLWANAYVNGNFGQGCDHIDADGTRVVVACSMGKTQAYPLPDGGSGMLLGSQPGEGAVYGLDPATGGALWARVFGTGEADAGVVTYINSVDVTPTGTTIAGTFQGAQLTDRPANAIAIARVGNNGNGFVAELGPGNGVPLWGKGFGDSTGAGEVDTTFAAGASVTGVLIAGTFQKGNVDLGLGPHAAVASTDSFVGMLNNKAGAATWERYFSGASQEFVTGTGFDECGRPLVMVTTYSVLPKMDGVAIPAPQTGSEAVTVNKFDPALGKLLWSSGVTPGLPADTNGINQWGFATNSKGNTFMVGDFRGSVDLGGGAASSGAPGSSGYVVIYGP